MREVKVARAIVEHSREVWLAADAQQVQPAGDGRSSRGSPQVDWLFTDAAPPDLFRDAAAPRCAEIARPQLTRVAR